MQIVIDISEEKYNQIVNSYQGSNVRPKDYEIAIINGTPFDKVIENIKAEINEAYQQSVTSNLYYAEGLERAFEIIDKHISGDMRGAE